MAGQPFSFSTLMLLVGSLICETVSDDLYCVGGDVKPYTLTVPLTSEEASVRCLCCCKLNCFLFLLLLCMFLSVKVGYMLTNHVIQTLESFFSMNFPVSGLENH